MLGRMDEARQVREFWFGTLPMSPETLNKRMRFWFGGDESLELRQQWDEVIRTRFAALIERAASGGLDSWAAPRERLLTTRRRWDWRCPVCSPARMRR
jgi:uncharacterized protein (DUF924 family)